MAVIFYEKKYGETLAEMKKRFVSENPLLKGQKITYAGRLDPLACGVIVLLSGDDVHRKAEYTGRSKTYRMQFFFGAGTDTGDVLGLIKKTCDKDISEQALVWDHFVGPHKQSYPAFSSKTVEGKPLWLLAREGSLENVELPTKDIEIFSVKKVTERKVDVLSLKKEIFSVIQTVQGDFRQKETLARWDDFFKKTKKEYFLIYEIEACVSSGTYMRALAERIGKEFSCAAVSLKIERISYGDISL